MSESSFIKGLLLGATVGAVAGILLAPKSGEETRKDLKKLAEDLTDRAAKLYEEARKEVNRKIGQLKKAGKKIDELKYKELVLEVVEEVKKDATVTADVAKRLGTQLQSDWEIVRTELSK